MGEVIRNVAQLVSQKRNVSKYIIDDHNRKALNQITYYLVGDSRFNDGLHKGLFIRGPVGTGKTMPLEIITEVFKLKRFNLRIYNALEVANIMRSSDEAAKKRLLEGYIAIDDVGIEDVEYKVFGSTVRPIFDVISSRYATRRFTFITTNLTPSEIEARYGNRVRDRLREMTSQIVLNGESRRK
jgi:DNA replication protein DnaC